MDAVDLLDTLISSEVGASIPYKIELRHNKESFADARLYFKERDLSSTAVNRDLVERLAADPNINVVRYKRPAISVRFADSFIMALGEEIEHGRQQTAAVAGVLPYTTYMVGFAGPNTNKALHIGHMRNIVIGSALAALLESAGAQVHRHSLVGDIGRSVCEALAGLADAKSQGSTLEGTKADQFVGQCYASYVSAHPHQTRKAGDSVDDPVARELYAFGDRADDLMGRWLAGEREVREEWYRVRESVMEGHRQTLDRLGIRIQRFDYESDAIESISGLVARGLRMGIFESNSEGTVFYRSGRPEFGTMVMLRQGRFPTEHARLIAVYFRLQEERPEGHVYLDLAGSEWKPASDIHMELMKRLRPEGNLDSHVQLFHGMVTVSDSKIASRSEETLLIDNFLDDIAESELASSLAELSEGAVTASTIANLVAKSFFLFRAPTKVIEFSKESFMKDEFNPAWTVARAWCHLMARRYDAGDDGLIRNDDTYRLAVIRSQEFPRLLVRAALSFDPSELANYMLHLCRQALAELPEMRRDKLMRSLLANCLSGLALLPTARTDGRHGC